MDRFGQASLRRVKQAQIIVRFSEIGLLLQNKDVLLDRFVRVTLTGQRHGERVTGFDMPGLKTKRFLTSCDRFVKLALARQREAQIGKRPWNVWLGVRRF